MIYISFYLLVSWAIFWYILAVFGRIQLYSVVFGPIRSYSILIMDPVIYINTYIM